MAVPGCNAIDTTFNLDGGPLLRGRVGVGFADPTPPDSVIFSQDKVIGHQNILPIPVHNRAHNTADGENTMTGHIGGLVILLEKESDRSCGQGCHQDCKLWLVLQGGPYFLCPLAVPTEPDIGHGGIKMPQ